MLESNFFHPCNCISDNIDINKIIYQKKILPLLPIF